MSMESVVGLIPVGYPKSKLTKLGQYCPEIYLFFGISNMFTMLSVPKLARIQGTTD